MYRRSKLLLTIGQKNSLKLLMKNTTDKRQYRRIIAILQKSNGRTFKDIAKEHVVNIRSVQRWVFIYLENGTRGLKIKKTGSSSQSRITDENKEIILSVLFNDPHLFGYVRNTWSLRSLAKCLTEELDIPISFKHLQRILKDGYWM
jgi:transposase